MYVTKFSIAEQNKSKIQLKCKFITAAPCPYCNTLHLVLEYNDLT